MPSVGKTEREQFAERTRDLEEDYRTRARKLEENHAERNEKVEEAARESKQSAQDRYESRRSRDREELEQTKAELYDRFGKMQKEQLEANQQIRDKAYEDTSSDFNKRKAMLDKEFDAKMERFKDGAAEQQRSAIASARESHEQETNQLRRDIKEALAHQRDFEKGLAEGREYAIKEYDDARRADMYGLQASHEREIEGERLKNKRQVEFKGDDFNRRMMTREQEFSRQMNDKQKEYAFDVKRLERGYQADKDQLAKLRAQERETFEKNIMEHHRATEERMNSALATQGERYRESSENQRAYLNEKIRETDAALQELRTTDDPRKVSQAAADNLRGQISKQYYDQMQEQERVHDEQRAMLREKMRQHYEDRVRTSETKAQRAEVDKSSAIGQERQRMSASYEGLKQQKTSALAAERDRGALRNEMLARQFQQDMVHQQDRFKDDFEDLRSHEQGRNRELRFENEMREKSIERDYSARIADMTREHEREKAEQRADFEEQINQLRYELTRANRDGEKRTKQALDDQTRMYESRIAALEQQQREREKNMQRNFEERLESIRRTNEFLVKKKG